MDAIHASGDYPDVPKGNPGGGKGIKGMTLSAKNIEEVLGMKFRSAEEMAVDTLRDLREKGFN